MEFPGWIFTCVLILFQIAGWYPPDMRPSPFIEWPFFVMVLIGPVLESFILSGLAWALGKALADPVLISVISGFAWGVLHAWGAPNALEYVLILVWSGYDFFIFTMAFLAWKSSSYWYGFLAAMLPHLAHDGQWKMLTLIC